MAIIKCHECGHTVSDSASACPACGAKPKKKIGIGGLIIAAIFTLFVVRYVASSVDKTDSTARPPADPQAELRHSTAVAALRAVKKSLRDPDSAQWESVRVSDNATIVCIEYRAKNGFGGYSKEFAIFVDGKPYKTPEAWNKHCTGPMHDNLFSRRAL